MRRLGWVFGLMMACGSASATSQESIQRGASLFRDYCAGCHALRYAQNDPLIKAYGLGVVSMPATDAKAWFGQVPPDLSLTAKLRGDAWLQMYLTSFYHDSKQPYGTNNHMVPNLMMPNPLTALTPAEMHETVNDVVAFLVYTADPSKSQRMQIGIGVILFLFVGWLVVYPLQRLYWRKVKKG